MLNALTHTAIVAIVLVSIVVIYQLPMVFDLPALFESLLTVTLLATGVSTLNCYLTTAFPVWEGVWSLLTRLLFLMSGIFFLYGMMPPQAQNILW